MRKLRHLQDKVVFIRGFSRGFSLSRIRARLWQWVRLEPETYAGLLETARSAAGVHAADILHDLIEDSRVPHAKRLQLHELENYFGRAIRNKALGLHKLSRKYDGLTRPGATAASSADHHVEVVHPGVLRLLHESFCAERERADRLEAAQALRYAINHWIARPSAAPEPMRRMIAARLNAAEIEHAITGTINQHTLAGRLGVSQPTASRLLAEVKQAMRCHPDVPLDR